MSAVGDWGAVALAGILALSCLGIPVPTSLAMLAVGALVAEGEMELGPVIGYGIAGAVAGDQIGYFIGRLGGPPVAARLSARFPVAAAIDRARALVRRWGGLAVFFTRWLLSPTGPYVNLVSGMAPLSWLRFTIAGVAGETVWVCLYVALGMTFSESVQTLADLLGNLSLFLVGLVATAGLGFALVRSVRRHRAAERPVAEGAGDGDAPLQSPGGNA